MEQLGMNTNGGGNYSTLKKRIDNLEINTSHWTGQGWLKGQANHTIASTTQSLESILVVDSTYTGYSRLKKRLLKQGLLAYVCSTQGCVISSEWLGQPIALHLDHINGIKTDNRIENLRLLCPNCHSQTSTYCGKNKKKK